MRKCLIFICICCILCCMTLAGCVSEDIMIKINADGSGEVDLNYGFTEPVIEMLVDQSVDKKIISEYKPFEVNGQIYYGASEMYSFNNIDEFNSLFNQNFMMDYGFANMELSQIEDYFCLTLNIDKNYDNFKDILLDFYPDLSETDLIYLNASMAFKLNFIMPGNIYSLSDKINNNVYISMNGCTLNIDLKGLYNTSDKNSQYKFIVTPNPDVYFVDVSEDYWGRHPIYSLAYGGLVLGVGGNMFNPNANITRGEFYTILARAIGLKTYEKNDYWAYGAIYSCGDNDLIVNWSKLQDKENIIPEEWDVPILREEAVSSVYLGYKFANMNKKGWNLRVNSEDIPDYSFISPEYADNVLNAYKSNIVHGVDDSKRFNPKGSLKRVEICQLFYNIGWYSPMN